MGELQSGQRSQCLSKFIGFSLLCFAIVGLGICSYLFSIPTDPKNAVILGFSFARIFLIVLNLLVIGAFTFSGFRCISQPESLGRWSELTTIPGFWAASFLLAFLASNISLFVFYVPLEDLNLGYYSALRDRLKPDLIWFYTISLWMLVTSVIGYWYASASQLKKRLTVRVSAERFTYINVLEILLIVLILFGLAISMRSFPNPVWGGDTDDYLYMADKSLSNREFFAGPRPWTTSLLYKLLGANLEIAQFVGQDGIISNHSKATGIVIAQTLIHAFSWILLGFVAASVIKNPWLRLITIGLILAIGFSPGVFMWNHLLLSESLSISLMVLIFAIWLWITKGWQWHKVFVLLVVSFLWIFTRESNGFLILGSAFLLFLIGLVMKSQRICLFVASVMFLFYIFSSSFSDIRNRWATPLANIIFQRILTNPQNLSYFVEKGMPAGPEVIDMTGELACSKGCALFEEDKYAAFREWLFTYGREVYIGYLISKFPQSFVAPFLHLDELMDFSPSTFNWPGYINPIPTGVSKIIFFQGSETFTLWVIVILIIVVVIFRLWIFKPAMLAVLAFLTLAYPHAFVAYHGDAMEIGRHAIQFSIQMRLCLWLLILMVLDWQVSKLNDRGG